jgi:hypothetical protein
LNRRLQIAILWVAPFLLVAIYALVISLLHRIIPHRLGLPSISTITTATLHEVIASPLWVAIGFLFTYVFGGIILVQLMKLFANSKLLRRKFVISTSRQDIEGIAKEKNPDGGDGSRFIDILSLKNFFIDLGLVLALNLAYTLFIQRYFQSFFGSEAETGSIPISRFLLSYKIILPEYALAALFLPLLTLVAPLLNGDIKIRQIDNSQFQYYWLGFVYSAAGGASLVLFLLNVFESKTGPGEFIIASLFIYAILSWYAALGMNIAMPYAERRLASELLKLREKDNIFFGKIFVGKSKEDLTEV